MIFLIFFNKFIMILEIIVLTLFISTVFNIILNKINMPTIIGYILTWIIISFLYWLHHLENNDYLKIIAEYGIVFKMFTIGLDFSVSSFKKMKKNVFFFGSLQFFIIFIIFYFLSIIFLKVSNEQSLIISLWLTLSSAAIVLKILNENGDINRKYWNISLWILLFQDFMVIPILLIITLLSITELSVFYILTKTLLAAFILFIVMRIFWKYILDYFLYKVAKTKSNEIFVWSILFIVLWSSFLSHFLWFTYTLWAFISGILIAETHYKYHVEADFISFRDLLLWFFFVTVWMQLDLFFLYKNIWNTFLILILFLYIKIIVLYFILSFFTTKRAALKTSISLFQFWELGIIIFELAIFKNLLDYWLWQILIVVSILSMIITPFLLRNISYISDLLLWNKHPYTDWYLISDHLKDHIVLIWYWKLWKIIGNQLDKKGIDYIILENDIRTYKKSKKEWKAIIFGNALKTNILKNINIEFAKYIIISIWNHEKLFFIASLVKKMNISWKIIVKAESSEDEKKLFRLGIDEVILETEKTATEMSDKIKL